MACDFNVVAIEWERSGGNHHTWELDDFTAFIVDATLIDIRPPNALFTCSNIRDDLICSHLVRFLVSIEWVDHLPHSHSCYFARSAFDYKPLLLRTSSRMRAKPMFRLEREMDSMNTVSQV